MTDIIHNNNTNNVSVDIGPRKIFRSDAPARLCPAHILYRKTITHTRAHTIALYPENVITIVYPKRIIGDADVVHVTFFSRDITAYLPSRSSRRVAFHSAESYPIQIRFRRLPRDRAKYRSVRQESYARNIRNKRFVIVSIGRGTENGIIFNVDIVKRTFRDSFRINATSTSVVNIRYSIRVINFLVKIPANNYEENNRTKRSTTINARSYSLWRNMRAHIADLTLSSR